MKKNPYRMAGPAGNSPASECRAKQDIAGAAYQATPGAGTAVSFRLAGLPLERLAGACFHCVCGAAGLFPDLEMAA
jgi:hypothetical protein